MFETLGLTGSQNRALIKLPPLPMIERELWHRVATGEHLKEERDDEQNDSALNI